MKKLLIISIGIVGFFVVTPVFAATPSQTGFGDTYNVSSSGISVITQDIVGDYDFSFNSVTLQGTYWPNSRFNIEIALGLSYWSSHIGLNCTGTVLWSSGMMYDPGDGFPFALPVYGSAYIGNGYISDTTSSPYFSTYYGNGSTTIDLTGGECLRINSSDYYTDGNVGARGATDPDFDAMRINGVPVANGDPMYFSFNGIDLTPPGPPPPSITFLYPTDGTTTPLFSNFIFDGANLTSTDEYQLSVDYFIPQVTAEQTKSVTVSGAQLMTYGEAVPFAPFSGQFGTSSYMVADADLYDVTDFQIPDNLNNFLVASTSAAFSVLTASNDSSNGTTTYLETLPFTDASGTISVVTNSITNPYPLTSSISSSTFYCTAPNDITDIGGGIAYGLCSAAQFLFTPNSSVQGYLQDGYNNFQGAFPFSLVFGIHAVLSNAITSSTAGGVTPSLAFTMPAFVPDVGGESMTFLTSSTLETAVGYSNFILIFEFEDALMWIFICWLMYEIVTTKKR